MESMYSLAHSVETEVQRQLSGEQEVAAGTPLSEALAYKGITRNSSISSASGGEGNTSVGSESLSFLSPRHEQVLDSQNLYSPVPKKPSSKSGASSSGGGALSVGGALGGGVRPVPKPRAATLNPRAGEQLDQHHQLSSSDAATTTSSASARGNRAETLANGYMQPRQVNRVGNYDQLPPGPPRPAVGQASQSPKQHRSALLRAHPSPGDTRPSPQGSNQNHTQSPTYINVHHMADDLPPMVDRKKKPSKLSPPRVDRMLKPKSESEDAPTSNDTPSIEPPPVFPTRTTSLANTLDNQSSPSLSEGSPDELPPGFPVRTTSLVNALEASHGEEEFSERDLPKPTTHTMQYTQVSFDEAGRPAIAGQRNTPPPVDVRRDSLGDVRRAPIPVPRGIGRVNYTDVDISATSALGKIGKGLSRDQVTLREAEREALQDKPYVNVRQEGEVDEDTDPGYYTHMRVRFCS